MAESRAAWGIDIGQSALKAIKVRQDSESGQITAEAFDYIPFPKILSQPDAIPSEILPEAMKTFLSRNELKGDTVAISVPGQSALTRFIQLPPVQASKLHEIVKYEARQQIPFPLEDVIWDYQPLGNGAEESGFLLDAEVGLFAMKRDLVLQQLRPYQESKVEVDIIQVSPLALYNVLSLDELGIRADSDADVGDDYYCVLDMGCDNTTLMVSNGNKIWIRNVAIGGNHFTRALTKEMKLSFSKAEHLKCNATKSPDPRAVFQALRPVFNNYVAEIQKSIGYFSSVNRSAKIAKVIGLGNGFKLAGLQKFLQQNLQYPVERPDAFKVLSGDSVISSPMFSDNVLSFAVPYGLALQGLGETRIRTSLLPPEISRARAIRKKKPWVLAAAAIPLFGFSLTAAGSSMNLGSMNTTEYINSEKLAEEFTTNVSGLKSSYSTQESGNEATKKKLDDLTVGLRDCTWIEVYNAVLDCLPRDSADADIPIDQPEKKNQISILNFSADRVSDRGPWFEGLTDAQKEFMSAADAETAPEGEGYIITIHGEHYHNDLNTPEDSGQVYMIRNFLQKLQLPSVTPPDFPTRDVTRLGISHATIVDHETSDVWFQVGGVQADPSSSRLNQNRGFGAGGMSPGSGPVSGMGSGSLGFGSGMMSGGPGGLSSGLSGGMSSSPGGQMGGQAGAQNGRVIQKYEFVIQFAFAYVAPEDRVDPDAETEGATDEDSEAGDSATGTSTGSSTSSKTTSSSGTSTLK